MQLTDAAVEQIAEGLPTPAAMLASYPDLLDRIDGDRRKKLFAAAAALQLATMTANPSIAIAPRTRGVTFGFIPLGPDIVDEARISYPIGETFTFGVSVLAEPVTNEPSQVITGRLVIADRSFPVIVTRSSLLRDSLPPHPGGRSGVGSSACWVKSNNKTSGWTHGVMTARHVVKGLRLRTTVTLDRSVAHAAPTSGWVADLGACSIDAAIVGIDPAAWPSGLKPLGLAGSFIMPIAPADPIELEGRNASPAVTGKTVSHHPLPHYWGSMMGQRLVIDIHGTPGDSGGLVTHTVSHDGVGLYMGRIADGAGGFQGLCQDLYQASIYLEADLYH